MTPDKIVETTATGIIFETLEYDRSVTCCWNSSTAGMFDIIMDYNFHLTSSSEEPACMPPVVFMARERNEAEDGYALFRDHAAQLGRLDEWVAWSEDEACAQAASTVSDTIAPMNALPYCQLTTVEAPVTDNQMRQPGNGLLKAHTKRSASAEMSEIISLSQVRAMFAFQCLHKRAWVLLMCRFSTKLVIIWTGQATD